MREFVIRDVRSFEKFLRVFNHSIFSLDTETTSLSYLNLKIEDFSLCDGKIACVVYLADYEKGYVNPEHDELLYHLRGLCEHAKTIIMAHAPFDLKVLYKYNILNDCEVEVFDIQVAHHLLDEEDRVSLKHLAEKYLGVQTTKFTEIEDHSSIKFFKYAINDAVWTWRIMEMQVPQLEEQGLVDLMRKVEAPFQYVLRDMAINGMKVDVPLVKEFSKQAQESIDNLYLELCELADIEKEYVRVDSQVLYKDIAWLFSVAFETKGFMLPEKPVRGEEVYLEEMKYTIQSGKTWEKTKWKVEKWDYAFNFNSSKQLGELLFGKMNLEVLELTPSGKHKVGKSTLEHYAKDNPFVRKLSTYKKLVKLQTSYLCDDGQIIQNLEEDGRVRPSFKDTGTATGRLSCSQPNLQQLPKALCLECGDELNDDGSCKCGFTGNIPVRSCFIVDENNTMITCDYSGQEVAVAAQQSQDPTLIDALRRGQDMHLRIANQFYELGIPDEALFKTHPDFNMYKKKFKVQRTQAKVVTFGLMYGKGAYGFSKDFGISEEEAEEIVTKYFDSMPKLKEAIDVAHKEIDATGCVTSMAGRKRHFKKEWNQFSGQEQYERKAYRQAFNFLIQGFSADMIRMAMNKVREIGKANPDWQLRTLGTVHDEAIYEVATEYKDVAGAAIKEAFETTVNFCVPVVGDVSYGRNYYEAK